MASRPIDEKIVVMKLDNSDFKQKAIETTGIFGKLKDGLNKIPGVNLGKTVSELEDINKQTKGISMDGLSNSLQTVTSKFTNLGIVGITALTNITNKAVDAGLALSKSLTLDQVSAGFGEYELKMGSIQTILANTAKHGTNLDDVSKSLNQLNEYADKTIYNFGDMTKNIGLFTNAGLKLEESTSMIKGFSNAAAASGTSAEGASNAAYQLSQALSAGTIRLMDWRSLTNVGMGNKNMQEGLIDLATAMGEFKGSGIDGSIALKDFNGSLEKNWLSADVMSKYLQIMAKDMGATEMAALGLSESQIKLFEQQATTAEEAATKVRTFTGLMDGLKEAIGSGWAVTFEHMFGDFNEATVLWTKLSEAVNGFFEGQSAKRNKLFEGIADADGFLNLIDGLQNGLKPITQLFGAVGDGFNRMFPPLTVNKVVLLIQSFKDFTAGLTMSATTTGKFVTIFHGVFSIFSTVWEITKRLTQAFVGLIPDGSGGKILNLVENIAQLAIKFNHSIKEGNAFTNLIDGLGKVLSSISGYVVLALSSIGTFGSFIKDNIGTAIDWIVTKLAPVGKIIKDAFGGLGGDDLLGAGGLVGIVLVVKKITSVFDDLTGFLGDAGGIIDSIKDTFEGVGDAVNNFATGVKIVNLVLISVALGILAVSLKTLEGISTEDISKGLTALAVSLGVMLGGMALISKFNITGGIGASVNIIALALAVSIMASALKKISDLNPKEMATGVGGLVVITLALAGAVIAMGKLGGKIGTSSLQLIALAGAVYILASAVKKMSEIDPGSLFTAIGALALIFAQLAIFLKVVDNTKFGVGSAIGILAVAGAIHLMVSAIQKIDGIDTDALVKGLLAITVILAQIAIFSKLVSGPTLMAAGVGLTLIAGAINLLMGPITALSEMSWEELVKGLGGMALALAAVAGAALLMTGSIGGALALVVMATGLNLLIGPIERFSAMTWTEMLKGFVGLAGGMLLLAGAALLLTPAVPSMLAFGAGLLVMGVAILAAGAGMALFGMGLTALALLTATSITAIVASLGLLLKGLGELIPATVDFIVQLGLALIDGIMRLVPPLAEAALSLVVALLQTITKHLPQLLELGIELVVQLIEGIGSMVDKLVTAGLDLIITFIQTLSDAVRDNGPILISVVLELLGEIVLLFIQAGVQVIDALFGWIPGVSKITAEIGRTAEQTIRDNFGAEAVAKAKGEEFASGLSNTSGASRTAGKDIALAAKAGATSIDMTTVGAGYGTDITIGIRSKIDNVRRASNELANASTNSMTKTLIVKSPSRKTDAIGQHTGQGFANGISKKKKEAAKSAKSVATAAQKGFTEKMADAKYKFDMGKIDSNEYISELNKIKKEYAKTPANVRKVELEIKKIRDTSAKDREATLKKQADAEKKAIDDKKYYNELSLVEELKSWQKIQAKYKKGTDERSSADREVYRVKNEINKQLIATNEDYISKVEGANQRLIDGTKALNDELINETDRIKNSLVSFTGTFDKVSDMTAVSGFELMDNLKGQVQALSNWSDSISALSTRGLDEGLFKEIREMGPKAAGEIAALNSMTDEELSEYSGLWKTKNEIARIESIKQVEQLRAETAIKIGELQSETEAELEVYKNEWINKIKQIKDGTAEQFVGLNANMRDVGVNTIKGLMTGLSNMEPALMAQAKRIADAIAATIRSALQINSPSKVSTVMGEFFGDGLALGISNRVKDVVRSSKNLAMTAKDSLNRFIEGFELDPGDNELHFKAVIDYDGIDPKQFGNVQPFANVPDVSYTVGSINASKVSRSQNDDINRRDESRTPTVEKPVEINQHLSFHSNQMTPSEVARKSLQASRQLAMQYRGV